MPPLLTLLTQLIVVLGAARAAGWLALRLRQPRVVGEMAAGLLLGPSLLGWLAPGLARGVLAADQLGGLQALSQLGLLLFMFLIGLELRPQHMRGQGRATLAIGLASVIVPFGLGAGLGLALYPHIAGPGAAALHVALFLGTALSVTAFPVLARILVERRLLQTPVGALAIACAAVDDMIAWCLLAVVVLLVHSAGVGPSLWLMLAGSAAYLALMLTAGRALAARLLAPAAAGELSHAQLAGMLLAMLGSAALSEWIGIHALFGAFLAGAIMPRNAGLLRQAQARLEDLTLVLLLPLFFASAGLRADIGLLSGGALWAAAGLILAAAVLGKLGGAALAARACGMPWRDSLALGTLMNTRGLMELVVASVGLEIGVITPAVFTILVLIAVTTTCLTGPVLDLLRLAAPAERAEAPVQYANSSD